MQPKMCAGFYYLSDYSGNCSCRRSKPLLVRKISAAPRVRGMHMCRLAEVVTAAATASRYIPGARSCFKSAPTDLCILDFKTVWLRQKTVMACMTNDPALALYFTSVDSQAQ